MKCQKSISTLDLENDYLHAQYKFLDRLHA